VEHALSERPILDDKLLIPIAEQISLLGDVVEGMNAEFGKLTICVALTSDRVQLLEQFNDLGGLVLDAEVSIVRLPHQAGSTASARIRAMRSFRWRRSSSTGESSGPPACALAMARFR
jgi:hypothetical protein